MYCQSYFKTPHPAQNLAKGFQNLRPTTKLKVAREIVYLLFGVPDSLQKISNIFCDKK
jgi:hypothetical protein